MGRGDTILRRIFGRLVELPSLVELPLSPARESGLFAADASPLTADLRVTVGPIKSPDRVFELDDAVAIHVAPAHVAVEPLIDLGPRALEHYIVDHAVPNGLTYDGDIIVHAAGLELNGSAVILLGDSGKGKSTLSLNMSAAGWSLLGDDSVRLEQRCDGVWAWPSYPGIRLHPDMAELTGMSGSLVAEYGAKVRINDPSTSHTLHPAKLALICALGENAPFDLSPIGPVQRCSELVKQLFLPPEASSNSAQRFDLMAPFAEAVEGRRLTYERSDEGSAHIIAGLTELVQ